MYFSVGPDVFLMAEADVEHLAVAPVLDPRDRHVVGLLHRRLGHVHAHQDANLRRVEILELVDLVLDRELVAPRLGGGVARVVDRDRDLRAGVPRMAVERAADHLVVDLVVVVRVGGRVAADEAVTLFLEPVVDEIVERLVGDRQLAGGVEVHDVVVGESLLGEVGLHVLRAIDAEQVAVDPQLGNRRSAGES